MRFCMITTFYPPYNFGGDGIYIHRLANELTRRGHEVEVVHCADAYRVLDRDGPHGAAPNEPGVVVHTLHSRAGALSPLATQQTGLPALKAARLRAIIERGRFDVLHFHNLSLIGAGALAYGPPGAIRLWTLHEYWLICPMHVLWKNGERPCERPDCLTCQLRGRRPPQLWRAGSALRRWLGHADALIAPSRFTLALHRARGAALGLPDLPLHHLPYFLPTAEETADDSPAAQRARPYFLFVGRLEKIKGVQDVIEVFRGYDRADLLIAGAGEYGDALREQARGLPHIHFLGRLPHRELRGLYRGALAALVPSIWYEVFGIVTLEAFAMRTPIIARDMGALPEIVAESGGGLVYRTPGELVAALERLRLETGLRERLGGAGYATYRRLWTEGPHLAGYFGLIGAIAARRGLPLRLPDPVGEIAAGDE